MNLYNLSEEYEKILSEVIYNEDTGEIDCTSLQRLDDIKDAVENKAKAISSYIKNIDAQRIAISNAIDDMRFREKAIQSRIGSMKHYLLSNMERLGIDKIESPFFDIHLKKNPCKVDITNADEIPDDYKKAKVELTIDKLMIRDAIKQGKEVPGAKLIQTNRVEIK